MKEFNLSYLTEGIMHIQEAIEYQIKSSIAA